MLKLLINLLLTLQQIGLAIMQELGQFLITKKNFKLNLLANIDTLALGYQIGKITPYLLAGNVGTKQEIRYKGRTIKTDSETALIWGTALSYSFYNQTISINLIAPSKPLNLRYAVGFGYNFYI
jgi:hypothetical protein